MYRKVRDKDAPTQSFSYDLVRAVRINGKPRHKFVLGFGSPVSRWYKSVVSFWVRAFARMAHHGFTKDQQFEIADQLKRKGIPLPTVKECKEQKSKQFEWNAAYPDFASPPEKYDAVIAFIRRRKKQKKTQRSFRNSLSNIAFTASLRTVYGFPSGCNA